MSIHNSSDNLVDITHSKDPYATLHARVRKMRGKASEYPCVDCAGPALDWSTTHGTDGTDPLTHYEPRCRACHQAYDNVHITAAASFRISEKAKATFSKPEVRIKLGAVHKGVPKSPEQRVKMSAAAARGKCPSACMCHKHFQKCGSCGEAGHKKRTCPHAVSLSLRLWKIGKDRDI